MTFAPAAGRCSGRISGYQDIRISVASCKTNGYDHRCHHPNNSPQRFPKSMSHDSLSYLYVYYLERSSPKLGTNSFLRKPIYYFLTTAFSNVANRAVTSAFRIKTPTLTSRGGDPWKIVKYFF